MSCESISPKKHSHTTTAYCDNRGRCIRVEGGSGSGFGGSRGAPFRLWSELRFRRFRSSDIYRQRNKDRRSKNTSKPYTANVGPWLAEASRGLKRVKPNGCTTGVSKPTTNDRFPRVVCGGSCNDSRTQISLTLGSCRQCLRGGSMRRILSLMCDELEHLERGWLVL